MSAKKKRAATAPSKKPVAKKAAPKKAPPKKAAPRQAAPKKAAPKKATPKKAAAKKPAAKKPAAKKPAAKKPAPKKAASRNAAPVQPGTLEQAALPAAPPAPRKPALPPDPTEELAQALAALALNKKADDVIILRVTELTSYADFFVLASAPSDRQVQAIARFAAVELKKAGKAPLGTEGLEQGHWVLVDYGAVVLHVFLASARQYYDLEGFWSDAPAIDVDEARGTKTLAALEAAAADAAALAADTDESPAFAANE